MTELIEKRKKSRLSTRIRISYPITLLVGLQCNSLIHHLFFHYLRRNTKIFLKQYGVFQKLVRTVIESWIHRLIINKGGQASTLLRPSCVIRGFAAALGKVKYVAPVS